MAMSACLSRQNIDSRRLTGKIFPDKEVSAGDSALRSQGRVDAELGSISAHDSIDASATGCSIPFPKWSLLTIHRFGIRRNLRVRSSLSGRIFETIDRKIGGKVEWLLNYARNASKPIPVASAITTKKVNAPRRLTPMRLLNPVTHRQKTMSAQPLR
jgi:hypothetical protein